MSNTCPSCQQALPEEAQFCPLCGYSFSEKQETSETRECSNCGVSYNLPAPLFCGSCGYELSEPSTTPLLVYSPDPDLENQPDGIAENLDTDKSEQSEDAPFEKNRYRKAEAILGVLIVVGIIFIGAASLLQKNGATPPNPTPNMDTIYTVAWETAVAEKTISTVFFTSTLNTQQPPHPNQQVQFCLQHRLLTKLSSHKQSSAMEEDMTRLFISMTQMEMRIEFLMHWFIQRNKLTLPQSLFNSLLVVKTKHKEQFCLITLNGILQETK